MTEQPTNPEEKPKPRRRWLRWSMRGFFIGVTLLCVVFGMLGRRLYIGMVHADVGMQLTLPPVDSSIPYGLPSEENVFIGWTIPQDPVGRIDFAQQNKLPTWMKRTNIDVFFRRLDHVLVTAEISDHELEFTFEQLYRLGELRELAVQRVLSADELDRLISPLKVQKLFIRPHRGERKPLPFLRHLSLEDLKVHGFPEEAMDDLPVSLKRLELPGADLGDDSLPKFVRLKNLETLDLSHTLATQEGIEDLRRKMPWCKITWEPRIHFNLPLRRR